MTAEEIVLEVKGIKSLVWEDDTLVDWVAGGRRVGLDGVVHSSHVSYAFRFDAAIMSSSARFVALYEQLGTKALILDRGSIIRELDRSFYHADVYEYPIAFLRLHDGTEAIAHCPRDYRRIDIEVAETGHCLTDHVPRKPEGVFHSRLAPSPGGTWLASAGWVWHPAGVAGVWSLKAALEDPRTLDGAGVPLSFDHEVEGLAFLDEGRIAVSLGGDGFSEGPPKESLSVMNLPDGRPMAQALLPRPGGTLVPFDRDHVLSLYEHPRLLKLSDGSIAHEWPHLATGRQTSSILAGVGTVPPFAKHPSLPMFAVADFERITVVRMTSFGS